MTLHLDGLGLNPYAQIASLPAKLFRETVAVVESLGGEWAATRTSSGHRLLVLKIVPRIEGTHEVSCVTASCILETMMRDPTYRLSDNLRRILQDVQAAPVAGPATGLRPAARPGIEAACRAR